MNDDTDLPGLPAPDLGLAAAPGCRQKQRIEKPEPSLFKRAIENRRLSGKRVAGGLLLLPAGVVLGDKACDGGMRRSQRLGHTDLADELADPITHDRDVF